MNTLLKTFLAAALLAVVTPTSANKPLPKPNKDQLRWQHMEMYAFIHYSLKDRDNRYCHHCEHSTFIVQPPVTRILEA